MLIKPKFYDSFRCKADKCTDTCCAGWEICLDGDAEKRYATLAGENGEWLRSRITKAADGSGILCREGERCPVLRDDNLCEMILRLGEGSLCDICREHPRFYSCTDSITLAGHGLCCEEAVRLWLTSEVEFVIEDDGCEPDILERVLLDELTGHICDIRYGSGALGKRLATIMGPGDGDKIGYDELRGLFSELEYMDADFPNRFSDSAVPTDDGRFVKLAVYFMYRYGLDYGSETAAGLTAASLIMIASMDGELADNVRLFSKEVEYDTDNIERICDFADSVKGLGTLAKSILKCR